MITDAFMRESLKGFRAYTLVVLHGTTARNAEGADKVVWEHGRRLFELKREGIVDIVCPVDEDSSGISGICILSVDTAKTRQIMDADPAVKEGIFTYDVHSVRGLPGDRLSD